ncbi:MAG: EAL domain-containing protein [Syntrophotaleaceae bacterium]
MSQQPGNRFPTPTAEVETMKPSANCLKPIESRPSCDGRTVFGTGLGCALLAGSLLWVLPDEMLRQLCAHLLTPAHLTGGLAIGLLGLAAGGWLRQRQATATLQAHQAASEKYQRLAFYDQLTGLPNRSLLRDRLEQYLAEAKRFGHLMGVVFLDLDRFKYINDSMGHAAGDTLLQMAAQRMQNCLRNNDTVARFAGDEFVIILSGFRDLQNLPSIAQKLLRTLAEPYQLNGREIFTTASLGIATYPNDGISAENLMRNADTAMYAAKDANGNTYRLFSQEMDRKLSQRLKMENSLRQALLRKEFQLLYQPQFDMRNGQLVGVEALVRWNHPEKGPLTPNHFIQLAEETGLIAPLGEWIMEEACRQWHHWPQLNDRPLQLAINLTSRQFKQESLIAELKAFLETTGLPPGCLELEITESTLMQNAELAGPLLRQIKSLGLKLSIDDFGSGYFSLAFLQNLPIDRLKIDPAFVQGGPKDQGHATILTTIIDLARNMDLELIAEGVESSDQIDFLLNKGCHIGQGYYFAEPLNSSDLLDLIETLLDRP